MRIHLSQGIQEHLVRDGYVLVKISKGIYGLKQAVLLAQQQLNTWRITISSQSPVRHPAFSDISSSCLVVDDFGVKY
jgi:hypothetical protein